MNKTLTQTGGACIGNFRVGYGLATIVVNEEFVRISALFITHTIPRSTIYRITRDDGLLRKGVWFGHTDPDRAQPLLFWPSFLKWQSDVRALVAHLRMLGYPVDNEYA